MNREEIKGHWQQIEAEARQHWAKLTAADWKYVDGDVEKLTERVAERYGEEHDLVAHDVDLLLHKYAPEATSSRETGTATLARPTLKKQD